MDAKVAVRPTDIEVDRDSHMSIRWSDGAATTVSVAALRRACPCATCREIREQAEQPRQTTGGLPILQGAAAAGDRVAAIADVEHVGRYALRLIWQDGHATGIYDYSLLRNLSTDEPRAAQN